MNRDEINALSGIILDACMAVHRELGPGLLESVYQFALLKELELRGINARQQVEIELFYKGFPTGKSYQMDMLVEEEIVVELKAVDIIHPVFEAQMVSYIKLSGKRLGLLVNFNVSKLINGFKRYVNGL